MNKPETIKEFIEKQLRDRYISARQFSDMVGVSHTTINRLISPKQESPPKIDVLLKISKATNTNILYLLSIAYPEIQEPLAEALSTTSDTLILSQRIEQLPDGLRDAIDTIISERSRLNEINDQVEG